MQAASVAAAAATAATTAPTSSQHNQLLQLHLFHHMRQYQQQSLLSPAVQKLLLENRFKAHGVVPNLFPNPNNVDDANGKEGNASPPQPILPSTNNIWKLADMAKTPVNNSITKRDKISDDYNSE